VGAADLEALAAQQSVRYINSGTWTESSPCPFVAVKRAEVRLEWWPRPGAAPDDSARETVEATAPVPAETLPAFG
jgi:hypothetical protein